MTQRPSCSRQAPSTELSAGGSSHSKSCDQLRCSPYLGGGDVADALSVHSAGSSSSDVEEVTMSFVPESPDGQEKKVTAPAFRSQCSPSPPKGPEDPSRAQGWAAADPAVPAVLGVGLPVVPGDLRHQLGVQQRLLLLGLHHARGQRPHPQALRLGGQQPQRLAAALQPAGGRLLHHPGQPGRGQRQHVQERPGERPGPPAGRQHRPGRPSARLPPAGQEGRSEGAGVAIG